MLTALAGGVGAARFLRGLVDVVDPGDVTVIVNTGDDEEFHGLHVSPDLDTVTYTLADAQNPETGWGLAGESFAAIDALETAETILVCPSNPVISIGPILAVPGIRDVLVRRRERVVGVSPIIGGRPVKGPADRLMGPLGIEVSCVGVAREYRDFCSA